MEQHNNLNEMLTTELIQVSNNISKKHEELKNKLITLVNEHDSLVEKINLDVRVLEELENKFVEVIKEITKRDG